MFVDIPTTSQQLEGGDVEEDWHADVRSTSTTPQQRLSSSLESTSHHEPTHWFFFSTLTGTLLESVTMSMSQSKQ